MTGRRAGYPRRQPLPRAAIALAVLLTGSPRAHVLGEIHAAGELAGQRLRTTVDSELARYYLEHHLAGRRLDAAKEGEIREALAAVRPDPADRESLRLLSERVSVDFASLFFVSRLWEDPLGRRLQEDFHRRARSSTRDGPEGAPGDGYLLAFVPGYGYRRNPESGADFARQRRLLEEAGYRTRLIATEELGDVEHNAEIIAAEIRRIGPTHDRIVLISTSKGGPEAAMALGGLLSPADVAPVRAWISVGGLLRGSPWADLNLRWPRRWYTRLAFGIRGLRSGVVDNLATATRRAAFDRLRFPGHLLSVQYVAVPLSGHIGPSVRRRYEALSKLGPNDGLTLLSDELVPGGVAITALGLDHYYRDPRIDRKTVALTEAVMAELEGERSSR